MDNSYDQIKKNASARARALNTAVYILLGFWALMVLFPFYWMILTSIKSYSEYSSEWVPKLYSSSPTFQNYVDAFTTVNLSRYFLNTLIFTVVTTGAMIIVITLAAYAFARLEFRGKDLLFTLFLSLMMIPNELVIIT
ncbi:MAG: carbohydrate ABC transporter permease, partial [bacterium]